MKLVHKTGDIFTTSAEAIGHGVNCKGVMGAGIAKAFRAQYPEMYSWYRTLCNNGGLVPGGLVVWRDAGFPGDTVGVGKYVYNIASQNFPGADARLEWLAAGVEQALTDAAARGISTLALPRIGSGIGGLDAVDVEGLLLAATEQSPVDIELWTFEA